MQEALHQDMFGNTTEHVSACPVVRAGYNMVYNIRIQKAD